MTITVLLFASYAEALGKSSLELDLNAGATVGDLLTEIRASDVRGSLPERPLVAVNERYAPPTQVLDPGDEVAIIPPVAGG